MENPIEGKIHSWNPNLLMENPLTGLVVLTILKNMKVNGKDHSIYHGMKTILKPEKPDKDQWMGNPIEYIYIYIYWYNILALT